MYAPRFDHGELIPPGHVYLSSVHGELRRNAFCAAAPAFEHGFAVGRDRLPNPITASARQSPQVSSSGPQMTR
jgi:hypothetical protein